jgi:hypothetical protein
MSQPLRLWGGARAFVKPTSDVEPAPYVGADDVAGLAAPRQLIDGQAARIDFAGSGGGVEHFE